MLAAPQDCALDALVYWTPLLIHALLEGGAISLSVQGSGGNEGGEAGGHNNCGGKGTQLGAVLLTLVPFGLAAAASLALGHSSEVGFRGRGSRRLTARGNAVFKQRYLAGLGHGYPSNPALAVFLRALLVFSPQFPATGKTGAAAAHWTAAHRRGDCIWFHAPLPCAWPAIPGICLPRRGSYSCRCNNRRAGCTLAKSWSEYCVVGRRRCLGATNPGLKLVAVSRATVNRPSTGVRIVSPKQASTSCVSHPGPFWSLVLSAASPGTTSVALAFVNSLGKAFGAAGPVGGGLQRARDCQVQQGRSRCGELPSA
jgi:hypothetical protein